MFLERLSHFLQKPPEQKWLTIRFFAGVGFSKLPYAPHRVHFCVAPTERVSFWWSYMAPNFKPERSLLDYWGDDVGELRFLWRILQPGMTFLDVGAYHGIYTLVAAKKLGGQGRVLAFEPSERERRRLRLHLRLNHISAVALEPYAVSSQNGRMSFYRVVSGPISMNSLRQPAVEAPIEQVSVQTTRLDDYLRDKRVPRVDLLKVDTEGGELEVFAGAHDLLARVRPLLICEVLDWVTRPWGYQAREIVLQLREYKYDCFDFRQDGMLFRHQLRDEYLEVRNYLAVPREKLAAVQRWVQS